MEAAERQRRAASDAEEVKLKADIRAKEAAKLAAEEEAATKERAGAARDAARIKAGEEAAKKEKEKAAAEATAQAEKQAAEERAAAEANAQAEKQAAEEKAAADAKAAAAAAAQAASQAAAEGGSDALEEDAWGTEEEDAALAKKLREARQRVDGLKEAQQAKKEQAIEKRGKMQAQLDALYKEEAVLRNAADDKAGDTEMKACADESDECADWARDGECEKNKAYMLEACPRACNACHPAAGAKGL